jgi:hypothetical protein
MLNQQMVGLVMHTCSCVHECETRPTNDLDDWQCRCRASPNAGAVKASMTDDRNAICNKQSSDSLCHSLCHSLPVPPMQPPLHPHHQMSSCHHFSKSTCLLLYNSSSSTNSSSNCAWSVSWLAVGIMLVRLALSSTNYARGNLPNMTPNLLPQGLSIGKYDTLMFLGALHHVPHCTHSGRNGPN